MKKAFDSIVVMTTLAILGTVIALLARQSINAALILTWAPVAIGGTYEIGKAKGRNQ